MVRSSTDSCPSSGRTSQNIDLTSAICKLLKPGAFAPDKFDPFLAAFGTAFVGICLLDSSVEKEGHIFPKWFHHCRGLCLFVCLCPAPDQLNSRQMCPEHYFSHSSVLQTLSRSSSANSVFKASLGYMKPCLNHK